MSISCSESASSESTKMMRRQSSPKQWYVVQKESGLEIFLSATGAPAKGRKNGDLGVVRKFDHDPKSSEGVIVRTLFFENVFTIQIVACYFGIKCDCKYKSIPWCLFLKISVLMTIFSYER